MTLPLAALGIRGLQAAYRAGQLHPREVVENALMVIERRDPELRAFLTVTEERARADADRAARAFRSGRAGPLAGVPVGVKDLFDVDGAVTTQGSLVHREHVAVRDGGVVRRLAEAGAVVIGKTNTSEFGQSATTENRLGPAARTPWDPACTAGGSSGGSAAGVAVGACAVAVGSDGGGSVRVPAAYCGIVGLKPTHGGSVEEGGPRAMSDFADVGPLAARVEDLRVLAEVLQDERFPIGAPARLRVGICATMESRPVAAALVGAVRRAGELLEAMGHRCTPVELPVKGWQGLFSPLALADEWRVRGGLLRQQAKLLTDYERITLEAASRLDPAQVHRARRELPAFRRRVAAAMANVDVVCTPATAVPPFPVGQRPSEVAGEPVDHLWGAFPFTAPINVAGLPAAVVPVTLAEGLPVAVQLVGAAGSEARLLDLSEQLHAAGDVDPTARMRPSR